ncbi:MAG: tyrosine--tRNA ligase [Pseudomonadota bacterium]
MSAFKSEFLRVMQERGFIHQLSDPEGMDQKLVEGPLTAYIGFDCTARSLHVGNLMGIMILHWFQKTGNKPIALMGGGTTMVGDPSGKDESRPLRTVEEIADNKASIRTVFERLLTFGDGPSDALMVDNADWLLDLNYVSFLRDYGRHFSVNSMLTRDSVKLRLEREQHLSFLEFNYMILQAYDFVELNRRYGCTVQMGGSDQWGNIVSGVDLGRRAAGAELFAMTSPLLTTSSGAKMGKTADGAMWLNAEMLSDYDYWQFWRNTEDADVGRFLKLYTTLPMDEIARLEALQGAGLNDAKKVLATEATALVRGREAAEAAAETARITFEKGATASDLPSVTIDAAELASGMGILTALVTAGLASSNGEARRHVKGGAVKVNDQAVNDEKLVLTKEDVQGDQIKVSFGKKKHVLLKLA